VGPDELVEADQVGLEPLELFGHDKTGEPSMCTADELHAGVGRCRNEDIKRVLRVNEEARILKG
jgi:hypothetical protein